MELWQGSNTEESMSYRDPDDQEGLIEKVVDVARTSKATKGGRKMSMRAVVVVGDGAGKIGFGIGTAGEFPMAIQKGGEQARRNMINLDLNGDTLWYPTTAKHGATKVFMQPAVDGTGIIATILLHNDKTKSLRWYWYHRSRTVRSDFSERGAMERSMP